MVRIEKKLVQVGREPVCRSDWEMSGRGQKMKNPLRPALELLLQPLGEMLEVLPRKVVTPYLCFTKIHQAASCAEGCETGHRETG